MCWEGKLVQVACCLLLHQLGRGVCDKWAQWGLSRPSQTKYLAETGPKAIAGRLRWEQTELSAVFPRLQSAQLALSSKAVQVNN